MHIFIPRKPKKKSRTFKAEECDKEHKYIQLNRPKNYKHDGSKHIKPWSTWRDFVTDQINVFQWDKHTSVQVFVTPVDSTRIPAKKKKKKTRFDVSWPFLQLGCSENGNPPLKAPGTSHCRWPRDTSGFRACANSTNQREALLNNDYTQYQTLLMTKKWIQVVDT